MQEKLPAEFVLFDLEYTSWEGSLERKWSGHGEHREIIQIGAVRVTGADLLERDSLLEYVRPSINPVLSDFIMELTGITQRDIDTRGVPFADAYQHFRTFVGDAPAFAWGKDADVFRENGELNGAPVELPEEQFRDLRPLMALAFADAGVDIEAYSSGTLLSAFGKPLERRAHDALNDMHNLLDALRALRGGARAA